MGKPSLLESSGEPSYTFKLELSSCVKLHVAREDTDELKSFIAELCKYILSHLNTGRNESS